MASLREEFEVTVRTIIKRREDIKGVVDALLQIDSSGDAATKSTTPVPTDKDGKEVEAGEDPVVRFDNIDSVGWVVESPFQIADAEFAVGNVVASRPAPDPTKVELENRSNGKRVWIAAAVFDNVKRHMRTEYDSEFGFGRSVP